MLRTLQLTLPGSLLETFVLPQLAEDYPLLAEVCPQLAEGCPRLAEDFPDFTNFASEGPHRLDMSP